MLLAETTLRQINKKIYWAWKSMKQRCQNPRCKAYKNYGARGITVCDEWQEFEAFCYWAIDNGYRQGLDIDRINNNGGYTPNNCRWVSRKANVNNRRKTIYLTVNGEKKSRTEWEETASLPNGIVKSWVITHGTEYAESRVKEALEIGYKERDYSRNHTKVVQCVETGRQYSSLLEAAKDNNISPCCISLASRKNTKAGGYHWKRIG